MNYEQIGTINNNMNFISFFLRIINLINFSRIFFFFTGQNLKILYYEQYLKKITISNIMCEFPNIFWSIYYNFVKGF